MVGHSTNPQETGAERATGELHRYRQKSERAGAVLEEQYAMIRWARGEGVRPVDIAEALGIARSTVYLALGKEPDGGK